MIDYRKLTLERLGDRNALEVYAATPGQLRALAEPVPAEVLRRRPYSERWTWTPLEIIGHMVDVEWTLGWRTRTTLCDDQPQIMGMDQDKWVAAQRHNDADPRQLLDDFESLRTINLRLWRSLSHSQLQRHGIHSERGSETLAQLLSMYAGHDLLHLDQLRKYLAAVQT
jgi:hypothetical protein